MRTSRLKRCVTVLATAALGLGAVLGLSSGASAATATQASAASSISVLMKGYSTSTGLWGNGWWTSAVMLSTVLQYRQTTGDTQYDYVMNTTFEKNKTKSMFPKNASEDGSFRNMYLDDVGWWSYAWLQSYDITGDTKYLDMAKTTADYVHSYWDTTNCGGGVWWSTDKQYKAAIANELFLQTTASLHNRIPGDTKYLGWAKDEWNWFNGTGIINSSGTINDGLNFSTCKNNNQAVWSYNQGVVLSGLAELSKATGDASYLTKGRSIADAAIKALSRTNILTDPCDPSCNGDAPGFKGPFVRGLRILAKAANTTAYDGWLQAQADSVVTNDTNGSGQHGTSWQGPVHDVSDAAQGAGAAAIVSALGVVTPLVSGPLQGTQSGRCVDVPNSTTNDSTQVALWDCASAGVANQTWGLNASTKALVGIGGKCLDVRTSGTADGTPVQIYTCNGTGAQQWTVNGSGATAGTVVNVSSGKCLDTSGTGNGALLVIRTCNGADSQKWARSITTPPPPPPPAGGILKGAESGRCVDVPNGNHADGVRVTLWDCNGTDSQKFTSDGAQLKDSAGKCLDVAGNSSTDGAAVQLYTCNGTTAQQWTVNGDGTIVGKGSGKCLDAAAHGTVNRTLLQIWSCNGGANQKWSRS